MKRFLKEKISKPKLWLNLHYKVSKGDFQREWLCVKSEM